MSKHQLLLSKIAVLSSSSENESYDDMRGNLEEINIAVRELMGVGNDEWVAVSKLSGEVSNYTWLDNNILALIDSDGLVLEVDEDDYVVRKLGGW